MLASAFALVCLPLMSTSAEAANAGYYHPDDVAGASALFNQSAGVRRLPFGMALDAEHGAAAVDGDRAVVT